MLGGVENLPCTSHGVTSSNSTLNVQLRFQLAEKECQCLSFGYLPLFVVVVSSIRRDLDMTVVTLAARANCVEWERETAVEEPHLATG